MSTIRCLLVANRGEIARRVMRTARRMGIRTVAVYSEPDRRMPFVAEADTAVALGGSTAAESYLRIDRIVAAARAAGADAVHPGYGFLSENAAFAEACRDAGLVFVGPTPENIRAMGGKIGAKRLAQAAGVPVLPSAVVEGDDEAAWKAAAAGVGYPLLVKASAGGGGRGMRVVASEGALGEAVAGARREAESSFGDATVFLERYLAAPRHVEVQVFADRHGSVVHLNERECSVQRRHQKIVEESPSPALDPSLRERMGEAAVALTRAIAYEGAGTVEFLLDGGPGTDRRPEFFFLEMNTRLQVEHPVTECVTGADLVRWQLLVAMGEPLPLTQEQVELRGHAIEVRLYAEDAASGFLPSFGTLHAYEHEPADAFGGASSGGGLRFDDGVVSGSEVSTFYDPMLAKVIAHAPTRAEAAARLRHALASMAVHGVVTNRDYLVAVLGETDFLAGRTFTSYVETHPQLFGVGPDPAVVRAHLVAAALAGAHLRRGADRLWGFAPSGWRNLFSQRQIVRYALGAGAHAPVHEVAYAFAASGDLAATGGLAVSVHGVEAAGRVLGLTETGPGRLAVDVELDGCARRCTVTVAGDRCWVNSSEGQSDLVELPRFPENLLDTEAGGPTAPVPGRVVAVYVLPGDRVEAGQALVVMEAMKMEHRIEAAVASVVREVLCRVGDQVDAHQVLVHLDPAEEE